MSVFGVGLLDLLLLTFCFSVPFILLALVVTVLYRRDRRLTPPEPSPDPAAGSAPSRRSGDRSPEPPSGETTVGHDPRSQSDDRGV